jgi:RNA polymerase sigma-70 factor (ECF subfamily)
MLTPENDFTAMTHARTVELAKTGNNEAFDRLDSQHRNEIYGYLVGLVGNEAEAQDLTQETLAKAWKKLPTLRNVTQFRTWLYTIARNTAYDHLRQRRDRLKVAWQSWESLDADDLASQLPDPQEYMVEVEFLKLALAEIPEKYRDCLLLQIVGGFSQREVAEIVGITKESVSTYISTARKLLREIYQRLGEEFNEEEKGEYQ